MPDTLPTFYELQIKAKRGGCFLVAKSGEHLLYRQMPEGVPNTLIGKRKHFEDMVSLVTRATTALNDDAARVTS